MLILKRNIACYLHSYSGREPRYCGSRAYVPPWHHIAGIRQVLTGKDCEPRPAFPHVYPLPPPGLPTSKTGVKTVCLGFSHFNSRMALIPLSLSYISLDLSMSLLSNEKAHLFRPLMLIVSLSPFIFTILQVFQLFVCLNVWPLDFVLRLVHFHSCGMKEQTNVRVKMVKI